MNKPSSQKLASMADDFLNSAKVLLDKDKYQFYFVILYLLGTSVELFLKAIIISNNKTPPKIHQLTKLACLANVDKPHFLNMLTDHIYWKSKYHNTNCEHEKSYYEENSVAINFCEILNYANLLKDKYDSA